MIGIDLGTTNSAVSIVEAGFPILLADEKGRRLLPSVTAYQPGGAFLVGHEALSQPTDAVHSIKSLMGRSSVAAHQKARLVEGKVQVLSAGEWFTPVQLSAVILKRLKEIAEFRTQKPQEEAVITVPAYFNEPQRAATVAAANEAGLQVARLIAEPTAAALAYGLERANESTKVAVYDLGGGTFDISILEMKEGFFEVIATAGDVDLGGDDFDRVFSKLLGEEDLAVARALKHRLCAGEQDLGVNLEEFKKAAWPLLDRSRRCCEKVLLDAGLQRSELTTILLVGGSTRMPMIAEHVEEVFGQAPEQSLHPDEAVALGAGIQAGILSGAVQKMQLLDVTPLSLGIETLGGLMNVIIARNTTIPCKRGELFTNAVDRQESMKIRVLQGEREFAKDNWELGTFEIPFTPALKGQARVGVQFEIDASGLLSVLVRDTATGVDQHITLQRSTVDISNVAVEKMIDQSIEHAHSDMAGRLFAESKMKAEELLPALGEALSLCGERLGGAEREQIARTRSAVEEALRCEDGPALKKAVEELDEATEELAALVMQQTLGL